MSWAWKKSWWLLILIAEPLVPKDIVVRGFIIDSETGALEEVKGSIGAQDAENLRIEAIRGWRRGFALLLLLL